jgi:AcrR family transcriptional regulator
MTKRILSEEKLFVKVELDDESAALWDPALDAVARDLLSSAVRCFADHGYHATTTRDISTGARLSPAAMYVHFPSKELVLFEIIRSGHEQALLHIQDPAIETAGTAAEGLRLLVSRYTAWHARHHVAARVAQYELAGLTAAHYDEIVELRHATNGIFRRAVSRGVDDESFARLDLAPVVRAILSLSIDLVRWYRLDNEDSPERLGAIYGELALRMVGG